MTVFLPSDLENYINEKIAAGMYPSASEVIRAGFRLMQEQDELNRIRLATLRTKLAEGVVQLDGGDTVEYENADDFLQSIQAGGRQILAKRREAKP